MTAPAPLARMRRSSSLSKEVDETADRNKKRSHVLATAQEQGK